MHRATHRTPSTYVALLRGINVGGHRKVPMTDLKKIAEDLGFAHVRTYIQSGNLIVQSTMAALDVASNLESALANHFGFNVDIVVRNETEWSHYAKATPFPDAETDRPHLLMIGLAKNAIGHGAEAKILPYAKGGERIRVANGALWIDYIAGSGRSKITPAVLDRAAGGPVTTRNFKTVTKIDELVSSKTGDLS